MKRFWLWKGLKVLVFLGAALAVFGYAVMALWNWVLPPVTGLHAISYGQALALLVLARLLFGSFRGRRHGGWHWRHRMRARWEQMTPEERERLRGAFAARGRCCGMGPEAGAQAP
ncbi:MAG TPA: hypothetical protein VN859_00095 [Steroidobacteraceae bacterium]|nr:hypothetical protein [Steroidobacteraceae bacterium]